MTDQTRGNAVVCHPRRRAAVQRFIDEHPEYGLVILASPHVPVWETVVVPISPWLATLITAREQGLDPEARARLLHQIAQTYTTTIA